MEKPKEEYLVDDAMALTLRVSQLYGIVPLRFKSTVDGTYVYISRPLHYLNATIITGICLHLTVFSIQSSFDLEDQKSKRITQIYFISNGILCSFPLAFANYKSLVRMKCYLNCTMYINKIKKYVSTEHSSRQKKTRIAYTIGLEILILWIAEALSLYFIRHISSIMSIIGCYVFGALVLMEIQFAVMALNINSIFKEIKEQLKRILLQLTLETNSKDDCVTIKSESCNESNDIRIPMRDINLVIDMLGHFKHSFQDNKKTPRTKLASRIRVLNHSFVSTCAVIRKLNDEENIFLFFHITIFVLHLVTALNVLCKYVYITEFSNTRLVLFFVDFIWFLWHIVKPLLLIEPSQQTQDELSDIRLLVGQIMCHVNSESDPLLGATEAFFQQIILNDTTYTVMGICSLTRGIMSMIVGGATSILLIFMDQ